MFDAFTVSGSWWRVSHRGGRRNLLDTRLRTQLGKSSKWKCCFLMDFYRSGFDPLFSGVTDILRHFWFWSQKGGKTKLPKTSKMTKYSWFFVWKSVSKLWKRGLTPPPLIFLKKSIILRHKKSVSKLWIGRDPPFGKSPLDINIWPWKSSLSKAPWCWNYYSPNATLTNYWTQQVSLTRLTS